MRCSTLLVSSSTARNICRIPLTSRGFSLSANVKDRYYTQKHEWIQVDGKPTNGSVGKVGITDFAQKALGDVVYVELPDVNTQLQKGDTAGAIESVKAASDLYAPVSGEVVERNEEVQEKPVLVNKSCYDKGWLYKLKIANSGELAQLMDEQAYTKFQMNEENKDNETQHF